MFSEIELSEEDQILYDVIRSGDKNHLTINDTADYSARPFTQFDFADSHVFLNGVKLYSGIDYIDNGGFYPINNSTGIVGLYFTYPKYSGENNFTGYSEEPLTINHDNINPNSYLSFYNGVRQPNSNLIPHAGLSDLISGTLINIIKEVVYSKSK